VARAPLIETVRLERELRAALAELERRLRLYGRSIDALYLEAVRLSDPQGRSRGRVRV
jgi:hypothetical protein